VLALAHSIVAPCSHPTESVAVREIGILALAEKEGHAGVSRDQAARLFLSEWFVKGMTAGAIKG